MIGWANEATVQEFIPTHEWQLIPPDTAVPPGLHYRLDLSTGEKWAKLMEQDETHVDITKLTIKDRRESAVVAMEPSEPSLEATTSAEHSPPAEAEDVPVLDPFSQKEKILRGTGLFDDVLKPETMAAEEYRALVEGLWDRRQAEVRAVYEMMEHADQVIDPFIQTLRDAKPDSSTELLKKLETLEEMISTEDMAVVFVERGGWAPLTRLLDEQFPAPVRTAAAWVIGSALRQSEENKAWALNPWDTVPTQSALFRLMDIVDTRQPGSEALLSKVIYAIAAAADTNQEVQSQLVGPFLNLSSLGLMLSENWSTALRIKVLQLGTDLLMAEAPANSDLPLRLRTALKSWCGGFEHLTAQVVEEPNKLEKAIQAATLVKDLCPTTFSNLVSIFRTAHHHYTQQASPSLDPLYRQELLQALAELGADRDL